MPKITLEGFECNRCNHKWIPRDINKKPIICPTCKSPYWDTPRSRKTKRNGDKSK